MELSNYKPSMLRTLLNSVKLSVRNFLLSDVDQGNEELKNLLTWQIDIETALNDSLFEERQLPDERGKSLHVNPKIEYKGWIIEQEVEPWALKYKMNFTFYKDVTDEKKRHSETLVDCMKEIDELVEIES